MTRSKLQRAIEIALKANDGESFTKMAAEAVRSIELAMALEAEPDEAVEFPMPGVMDSTSRKDGNPRARVRPDVDRAPRIPPSPAVSEDAGERSRIILPGDRDFGEIKTTRIVDPLRPLAPPQRSDVSRKWWTAESLIRVLEERTPERLEVVPHSSDKAVVLERNILNGHGFDIVKLSYSMIGMKGTSPSDTSLIVDVSKGEKYTGADSEMQAMAIDLPVFALFSLTDQDLDLEEKLNSLKEQARRTYSPRTKGLSSSTPLKFGKALSFDARDPHVEAD